MKSNTPLWPDVKELCIFFAENLFSGERLLFLDFERIRTSDLCEPNRIAVPGAGERST